MTNKSKINTIITPLIFVALRKAEKIKNKNPVLNG